MIDDDIELVISHARTFVVQRTAGVRSALVALPSVRAVRGHAPCETARRDDQVR